MIINNMRNDQMITKSIGASLLCACALLPVLTGCGPVDTLDTVINEIEKARQSAVAQSDAWRAALPKLVEQLDGLESQAVADSKAIIADTRNQAQELLTESIKFANINAQEILAKTGVEFRCNANYAMSAVSARLQYLIDDLKFWKKTKHHIDKKPAHVLCQIVGSPLSLYPIGNNRFGINSTKLMDPNIVGVFGYNFRADALPRLELRDSSGNPVRDLTLSPAYVTQYQLMLDFSTETFTGAAPGAKIRLLWPDAGEPNEISLLLLTPAKLKIVNHVFTPSAPIMKKDAVKLSVTVENQGSVPSGPFVLSWTHSDGGRIQAPFQSSLNAGESRQVHFADPVVYQTEGQKRNVVSISTGDDAETFLVDVASNIASRQQYRIDKPRVNTPWAPTGIPVQPGDRVEVVAAGGCVNPGGAGPTTKRYVDPLNTKCRDDDKYYGTIAIPGTIEESERRKIGDFMKDGVEVMQSATIWVGYVDDAYGNNGYWGMDDLGTCEQCRDQANAYVEIRVTHFK